MSDGMEFGEREAPKAEATYETPAVAERREFVREMLDPREDDAVLSIGCPDSSRRSSPLETVASVRSIEATPCSRWHGDEFPQR